VKITIQNRQKKIRLTPKIQRALKLILRRACAKAGMHPYGTLSLSLVDDRAIRELNLNYLGRYCPTDVIAFDFREAAGKKRPPYSKKARGLAAWADIIVSTDTAVSQARAFKTNPVYEMCLYACHGMLHVLGYNDEKPKQRKIMEKIAAKILAAQGVE